MAGIHEAEDIMSPTGYEHDLMIRIDERTKSILSILNEIPKSYVTKDEFKPVRLIVYGMVGSLLLAILGAIASLVLRSTK